MEHTIEKSKVKSQNYKLKVKSLIKFNITSYNITSYNITSYNTSHYGKSNLKKLKSFQN